MPPGLRLPRLTARSSLNSLPSTTRPSTIAQERVTRVRRDYTDGKLDADDWTSFRDELTSELEATNAQVRHLEHRRQTITADTQAIDAEAAVLEDADRRATTTAATPSPARIRATRCARQPK
jgi:outer membrane murein-binding lipoprotein Lpp